MSKREPTVAVGRTVPRAAFTIVRTAKDRRGESNGTCRSCLGFEPYQPVPVDPLALVHPQEHELLCRFKLVWLCDEQSLEHVTQVPDVELVVEVRRCLPEVCSNLLTANRALRYSSCK